MQEASSVTVIAHTIVVALTGTFPLAQWTRSSVSLSTETEDYAPLPISTCCF